MGELLAGHLDLLILAAVRSRPSHGFGISEELRRRSRGELDVPMGSIYPALYRLEAEGLLKSRWVVEGRKKRIYELTQKGRLRFGEQTSDWKRFSGAVQAVLDSA